MGTIQVTVVTALPSGATIRVVEIAEGATVREALEAAGVLARQDPERMSVGIFARRVSLASRLRSGDRVEIYRPLSADPKEARRRRAAKKRSARRQPAQ